MTEKTEIESIKVKHENSKTENNPWKCHNSLTPTKLAVAWECGSDELYTVVSILKKAIGSYKRKEKVSLFWGSIDP